MQNFNFYTSTHTKPLQKGRLLKIAMVLLILAMYPIYSLSNKFKKDKKENKILIRGKGFYDSKK